MLPVGNFALYSKVYKIQQIIKISILQIRYEKIITLSSFISIEFAYTLLLLSNSTVTGIDCPGIKPLYGI